MHDKNLESTAFWIWSKDINPRESGPYLCTMGKTELERKGDKSSRTVWAYEYDIRSESWIDIDEDGEYMMIAWAEMPRACDIGKRFIEDKLIKLEQAEAERIICKPESGFKEIPLSIAQMAEEANVGEIKSSNERLAISDMKLAEQISNLRVSEFIKVINELAIKGDN